MTTSWRREAACARPGVDPELFYPLDLDPTGQTVTAARRVCGACPVRGLCLADVMASEDPARRWGVIAGLTPDERTEFHRDQLIPAPAVPGTGVAA